MMFPRKPVGIVLSESFGPISKSRKRVFYGSQNLVSRVIWGFCVSVPNFKTGVSQSRTLLQIKRKKTGGVTSLQEADGDVPLDVVALTTMESLFQWRY